jgi:hypothetical protein
MAEKGFWPLYEGKHIEQFLVDIKPIERWVSLEACEEKYGRLPRRSCRLLFRRIARNTDDRTCIAAVVPEASCSATYEVILPADVVPDALAAVFNSFAFDYGLRLRIGGTTLNFTYIERLATPLPAATSGVPALYTRSVAGTPVTNVAELPDLWPAIAALNLAVAEAYGLSPDEFKHILSTFPVLARKRPAFFAYLRERVAEWEEEVGKRRNASRYPEAGALSGLGVAEGSGDDSRAR